MTIRAAALAASLTFGLATAADAQWAIPPKPKPAQPWAIPKPAFAPKVGTLALARFPNSTYWWPALVQEVRGDLITVQYGGGKSESLPSSLVAPLRWTRGTPIECKFAGAYVPLTITSVDFASYAVTAVGGDARPRSTKLQYCRSKTR